MKTNRIRTAEEGKAGRQALSPLTDPAVRELLDHLAKILAEEYVCPMKEANKKRPEIGTKDEQEDES